MSTTIVSPILGRLERRLAKPFNSDVGMKSTRMAYEIMLEEYRRVFYRKPGEYLIWCQNLAPRHMFSAMDNILVLGTGLYTNMLGTTEIKGESIDLAESWGFSKDICSRDRAMVAEALRGHLPKPDLFVSSTNACEAFKLVEYVCEHLKIPYFMIDLPFGYDEDAMRWCVEQLEDLIRATEELTHQKLDRDRLAESTEISLHTEEIFQEMQALRKAVPSPLRGNDSLRMHSILLQFGCNPKTTAYLEASLAEVKEKVAKGEGVIPNERHRILWLQTQPNYVNLFDYLEKEFGAVIAMDELSDSRCGAIGLEREAGLSPLDLISKAMLKTMWKGPVEVRLAPILEWARDYHVDACIHFSHWGCRSTTNSAQIIKDALQRELGIPTLILDGDYHDASNYSEEQTKNRIRAFMETLN